MPVRLRRIAAILLRLFYLLRGSSARIVPLFAWQAVDIVLWGFISRYLDSVSASRLDFVPVLLGAMVFWDFLVRALHGVVIAFMEDVWSRNFLNVFAAPVSISEYLTGLILFSVATSILVLVIMVALATAAFGLSFFAYGVMLVPFLLLLFLFGIALGIFGAAVVLRWGPAAEWLIWPIPALLSPLACVFYPLSALPTWLQWLARLVPPSYVFEGMRQVVAGGGVSLQSLLVCAALTVITLLASCLAFLRIFRHAVRTGLIARYSAESVS
ncbi:MAG: ABC transporter permease [Acidobacteria bacterium]|nr:MAG: ABC transporter permease [Acidobacteriota bacterium]